jgi:condensin complex subunit 1
MLTPSRRTYDATLAELTSLEELMKTMMAEGQVHPDVIAKLWQAYGKHASEAP